jgi:hypothetical protein
MSISVGRLLRLATAAPLVASAIATIGNTTPVAACIAAPTRAATTTICGVPPSTLTVNQTLTAGQSLWSPLGRYEFVMQTDGNLVEYDTSNGSPLWATMTGGSGNWAVMQGDGNFVVYSAASRALWWSHTNPSSNDHLTVQDDGDVRIFSGSTALWASTTDAAERQCWSNNSCAPNSFAASILGKYPQAPYTGVQGPTTLSNLYAISKWEAAEGGGGGCGSQKPGPWPLHYNTSPPYGPAGNPMATTQPEPGSYRWNSIGVQVYVDSSGHPCWYWGIVATDQTLLNGYYSAILSVLRSPNINSKTQCINLANAVGASKWGTPNFSASC